MSRVTAQIAPTAYTPAAPPSVTLSTTSATVLAAATTGKTRTVLRIQNAHASNTIYLREDGGVAVIAAGGFHLKLGPGQGWDWNKDIPQGLITGIADGAGTIVAVTYAEV